MKEKKEEEIKRDMHIKKRRKGRDEAEQEIGRAGKEECNVWMEKKKGEKIIDMNVKKRRKRSRREERRKEERKAEG